ncbi:hypothetical protein [Bordetella hinzii]|uniref:N-acetyltransferase YedL n=1 Tax=Bordetella hinzii OH87 BAL007II TaxID=1331262 RepID=A0ABR4QZX9_9BORD|nr:hypothetical protein [Bordetella hinzii]KCB23536.1 hypothetical protein L544_4357 [Bordetella hinzii OH87 BAL007II]KCB32023.1 hypothetical protein L541_3880 [Bordetella hinzii CA90 BAL1384]KCB45873.1 hypothetical protein L539_4434 [Bordetella hinzii 5132]KCB47698.1 hypothetical protein L537_4303 [Bordetella hinzii 1277]WPL82543.1 hypothetical protein SD446_07335 [Bordetella hinzii]
MKNTAQRGLPMPGSRSMTQFRSARIRRVAFHWRRRQEMPAAPAADKGKKD